MSRPFTLQITNLHDDAQAQAILYATDGADHAQRNVLLLKLVNGAGGLVLGRHDGKGAPSVQIGLTGLVPPERADAVRVEARNAALRPGKDLEANHVRFDFFAQEDLRIAPGEALAFEARQIAIPPTFHRSKRVFLTVNWNGVSGGDFPQAGSLVERVHLVEAPATRRDLLPLEIVGADGRGGIVTVDTSKDGPRDLDNRFTFFLRNTSAQPIVAPASPPSRPRIFISFGTVETEADPRAAGALCTAAHARGIQLDFDLARATKDYTPRWRLARKEAELLWELAPLPPEPDPATQAPKPAELFRPGEAIAITVGNVVTRLPPGLAAMTLRCEGFPGHRDTELHLDLEKVAPRARIDHLAGAGTIAIHGKLQLEWRTRGGTGARPVRLAMIEGATGAPPHYAPLPAEGSLTLEVPPAGATWQVTVQGPANQDARLVPVDIAALGLQAVFYVDKGTIWRLSAGGEPAPVADVHLLRSPTDFVVMEKGTRLGLAAANQVFTCALDGGDRKVLTPVTAYSVVDVPAWRSLVESALWAGHKRPNAQWPMGSEDDEDGTGDTDGLLVAEPLQSRHFSDPHAMTWIRSPIQARRAPDTFYIRTLVAGTSGIGGRLTSDHVAFQGLAEVRFAATHGDVAGFVVDATRMLLYWIDARAKKLKRYWLDPTRPNPVDASMFNRRRVMLRGRIPEGPGLPSEGPWSELYTIPGVPEVLCDTATRRPANLFATANGDVYWLETPDGAPSYLRRWVRELARPEAVYRFPGSLESALMACLA